ncbi:TapB family protein [Burkholderia pseudomallei]|uniref:TapB family protein n=1 Tax=Burkholderia pseudomallei TaxID=28450 RepID=UPI0040644B43
MSVNASPASTVMRALAVVALLSFAAATASAADAASLPAPVAQPAPALTQAEAPVFAVGEQWTFDYKNEVEPQRNSTFTQKVTAIDGNGRIQLNGGAIVMDSVGNLVSTGGGNYQPSDEKLRFPLAVGKSWSASYVFSRGGWSAKGDREAKVVGAERIETPAGAFDTFRVEQVVVWDGTAGNAGHGTTREVDWYAPAVGRVIKFDYTDRPMKGAPTVTHVELVGFKPGPASTAGAASQ